MCVCVCIDPNDIDSPQAVHPYHRISSTNTHGNYPSPPRSPTDDPNAFSYSNVSNVGRMRTSSIASVVVDTPARETPRTKERVKHTMSDSLINAGKRFVEW